MSSVSFSFLSSSIFVDGDLIFATRLLLFLVVWAPVFCTDPFLRDDDLVAPTVLREVADY